ncbi:glycosyltransferase, partial [Streptomyces sp. NPDC126514]|uniref:glycosyltransferase n=1 Tax=Streptomyces sp. NPDC126514 TaxID=3155210 RepID=UPI00332D1F22
ASTRDAYERAGIPAAALHVIPNGVDLARFRPDATGRRALRARLGIPQAAAVVVFAARYDAVKNVPLFLQAARAWLAGSPDRQVLMCGTGMTEANPGLEADITAAFGPRHDLATRLHLLGVRRDMETVYTTADTVALTSRSEAAPLCLIEGMMCGAVPVTTDAGDSAAIVRGCGIVTPPDPQAIAHAWTTAATARAAFTPALTAARERFSRTRMTASYAAFLEHTAAAAAGEPVRAQPPRR